MTWEDFGSGGLGGLIGGILALLGFHRRLSRLEEKVDKTIDKETCDTLRNLDKAQFTDMKADIRYIRERFDEFIMMMKVNQDRREHYHKEEDT